MVHSRNRSIHVDHLSLICTSSRAKLPGRRARIACHPATVQRLDQIWVECVSAGCLYPLQPGRIGTHIVKRLLCVAVGEVLRRARFEFVQQQATEFGMGALDLTAVGSFPPIEHVHEEFGVISGGVDRFGERADLSLS